MKASCVYARAQKVENKKNTYGIEKFTLLHLFPPPTHRCHFIRPLVFFFFSFLCCMRGHPRLCTRCSRQ